jgi:hypothetical protein
LLVERGVALPSADRAAAQSFDLVTRPAKLLLRDCVSRVRCRKSSAQRARNETLARR